MKTIKRSEVLTACNTTMCIAGDALNYFGDSAAPVAVYDAADPLLSVLGKSDGSVSKERVAFCGVDFELVRVEGSAYLMLHART